MILFFFKYPATTQIYTYLHTLSLHDALPNVELREGRMKVKIYTHDRDFKIRTARKLLLEGDKVKVSVMLRARENSHPEVAEALLRRVYTQLEDLAEIGRAHV